MKIQVTDNFLFEKGQYIVNSSHHQAIKILGNGLEIFCMARDEVIEGVYLKEHPFFVVSNGIQKDTWEKFL